jgi:hypothetical protein
MKHIFITLLFLFISSSLFAFDWQSKSITHEKQLDNDELVCLKDGAGNLFFVEDGLNIPDEQAQLVLSQKDIFFALQNIKIKRINFNFENGVLYILVIPTEMKCDSTDAVAYLPSGMLFSIENGSLLYNFRIKKDTYFIRINGAYISEKVLCDKVAEAINTPQTFVQRRDPDYLLASFDKLSKENDQLKKAIIALNNKGFFSSDGPVDDKIITRVISLKYQNLKLTAKEIEEALKKENIQTTTRAVELILNVYFNEFTK